MIVFIYKWLKNAVFRRRRTGLMLAQENNRHTTVKILQAQLPIYEVKQLKLTALVMLASNCFQPAAGKNTHLFCDAIL